MKKLLYLLILSPVIYLTSCSSGGDNIPEIPPNLDGYWEVNDRTIERTNLTNDEISITVSDLSQSHPLDLIWEFNGEITGTLSTYCSTCSGIGWTGRYFHWDFVLYDSKSKLHQEITLDGQKTVYIHNVTHFTNTNLSLTRTDTVDGVEIKFYVDYTKMN